MTTSSRQRRHKQQVPSTEAEDITASFEAGVTAYKAGDLACAAVMILGTGGMGRGRVPQ